MKNEQLESLLIDQAFGELPEEVSALLDAYLAQHPEQAGEVNVILDAVSVSEKAVIDHPELVATSASRDENELDQTPAVTVEGARIFSLLFSPRFGAAMVAVLLAGVGGFLAGKAEDSEQSDEPESLVEEAASFRESESESPWARYRLGEDGQLAVVPAFNSKS